VFPVIVLIRILKPNGSIPTFVREPQAAFSPAPENFDHLEHIVKAMVGAAILN
jgi:hypothetical protein